MLSRLSASGRRGFASGETLLKTKLYDMHLEKGGKMVPFAGYELPVQYAGAGVLKEHMHCRAPGKASVFDVGHMGQIKWTGKDRAAFLEKAVVGDIAGLADGEGRLSLLTAADGGILDDTVITNAGDYIYMVVNGACKVTDMAHLEKLMAANPGMDVQMNYLGDDAPLVALQGDGAKTALLPLLPDGFDMERFAFMTGVDTTVGGYACRVTRCGYTGEDGFEIGISNPDDAVAVAELLFADPNVEPCGLGARDSLRLEAGLCLYGNDLDDTVNPVEGTLLWTIGPAGSRRRVEQGFSGAEHMLTAEGKPKKFGRKRVGFMGHTKPARPGAAIFDAAGEKQIGVVTSGTVSPVLGKPIAMGYVETGDTAKNGADVTVDIRGKKLPTKVARMPFVEPNYWRVPE
eukprot:CAMPEP_0119272718 /NCGR_PEP_ID=MMETSP1329-20130426/8973_1 /TAXON_ID=114041 /ORGANISM="Genus nov. species nov., Strain RCC1024" /LENGTH=401 /DNA_ID=CAMNT_0007272815 /DNA_START=76 /DNA_END=1281 /DNA_ORIENTATION=-